MRTLTLCAALAMVSFANAGTWTFTLDGGSLASLENGAVSLTSNGNISFGNDTVNGGAAQVATLTQNGTPSLDPYFSLANPIGGNGGGTRTNQYSILLDVNIPAGGFHSLFQTGSSHNATGATNSGATDNDGDWFINGSNGMGISSDYTDAGNSTTFVAGAWTRIILTINTNTPSGTAAYSSYVNGTLQNVVQSPSSWGADGRYSLGSIFSFFADEDSELRSPFAVNNIMLFDSTLTAQEVASLGGATAGAPVPEPMTLGVLAIGMLALKRKRK